MAFINYPEGKAQGGPAYFVDSKLPWPTGPIPYHVRTHFDCWGMPFGPLRTWYERKVFGLAKLWTKSYTSFGSLSHADFEGEGVLVDVRTLQMLIDACCPPELLLQFLATEEAPD